MPRALFLGSFWLAACAPAVLPHTEIATTRSAAAMAPGQVQVAMHAGGLVNELGHGTGVTHLNGQVGIGKGLALSLSGYDLFSARPCGRLCAGHAGLRISSDRPDDDKFPDKAFAVEIGGGMGGGGQICTPLPPPEGPAFTTCIPRPNFYGGDLSVSASLKPHHSASPYASAGLQVVTQPNANGQTQLASWGRGATGLELSAGRMRMQFELGALATGLEKIERFDDVGRFMVQYYFNTGVQFTFGAPPEVAPEPAPMLSLPRRPQAAAPASTPTSLFVEAPAPPPINLDDLPPLSARLPLSQTKSEPGPASAPASQPAAFEPAPTPLLDPPAPAPLP